MDQKPTKPAEAVETTENQSSTPNAAPSDEKSRIIIVVDETGSMHRHKAVTISSYNEWLDSNRSKDEEEEHHPKFSLVKFNTVTKLQEYESVETAPSLTNENYNPNNMTALYDALGETLETYSNERDNIMVILTDGEENASRKWTQQMIQKKIKEFTDERGWIFHYLGANQDAWAVGQTIGIMDKKFTTTYAADTGGFDHAFAEQSKQTKHYRSHQAMKKKGMFTPSLANMAVPKLDKASYLASKSANSATLNATVSQSEAKPTNERVLFNSSGGDSPMGIYSNSSNQAPMMRRPMQKMKKKCAKGQLAPQAQRMQQMQQAPMQQMQIQIQPSPDDQIIQQAIDQSQQNRVQIQADFDQLYQNSDADMQAALRNSLNENY